RSTAFIAHSGPPAVFARATGRPNVNADPRSSFGRRDDRPGGGAGLGSRGVGGPIPADSARRRDIGDPGRARGTPGFAGPGADISWRRCGEDAPLRPGPGVSSSREPSRSGVRDVAPRPSVSGDHLYRPLPDSYRRASPDESPRHSIGPRPEQPRFET